MHSLHRLRMVLIRRRTSCWGIRSQASCNSWGRSSSRWWGCPSSVLLHERPDWLSLKSCQLLTTGRALMWPLGMGLFTCEFCLLTLTTIFTPKAVALDRTQTGDLPSHNNTCGCIFQQKWAICYLDIWRYVRICEWCVSYDDHCIFQYIQMYMLIRQAVQDLQA